MHRITPHLWVGATHEVVPARFDLVLTISDHPTAVRRPTSAREVVAAFPDSRLTRDGLAAIRRAVGTVLAALDGVAVVCIRCARGTNRSRLIAALVLRERGHDPEDAVALARTGDDGSLVNPYFVDLVYHWPRDPVRGLVRRGRGDG